mgnify:CR=1 FL=1
MTNQRIKSVRLPIEIIEAVEYEARQRGVTFTDVVESGLRKELNLAPNPTVALLIALKQLIEHDYPNKSRFPQDITRRIFLKLRDEPELRALYDAAIACDDPENLEHKRNLHRQLGLHIKRIFGAKVLRKTVPVKAPDELIRVYSLLVPAR